MSTVKKLIVSCLLSINAVSVFGQNVMPVQDNRPYISDEWLFGEGQSWHHNYSGSNNGKFLESRDLTLSENQKIKSIEKVFNEANVKAIVLGDKNKIVKTYIKSPANENSLFLSLSIDKTVTAISAGVAICDNKISLNTKVKDVLPELSKTDIGETTLKENLTMSSGTTSSFSDGQGLTREELNQIHNGQKSFMDMMKDRWGRKNNSIFHSKSFDYKSQDPNLVGMMISAAYGMNGKNFRKWQDEYLWTKVKTNDRRVQGQDRFNYAWAEGNTRMTLKDWTRFAIYVNEKQKENSCMGDFIRDASKTHVKNNKKTTSAYNGYGYFIWTESVHVKSAYAALGYGGQAIIWNTSNDKFMIIFSNQISAMEIGELAKIWIES